MILTKVYQAGVNGLLLVVISIVAGFLETLNLSSEHIITILLIFLALKLTGLIKTISKDIEKDESYILSRIRKMMSKNKMEEVKKDEG